MSIFTKFNSWLMKNNLARFIFSLFLAIILWFIISITKYPSVQKTIDHITLSTDIDGTSASDNGLSVISCDVQEVEIEIIGSRTQVGNLTNDNLEAYIDAENVTAAGTKTLTIKVRGTNGSNYEVKSISPATATVVFDKYDTREFAVKPKIPNVSYAKDKAINEDEFSCEPSVVRIYGPSAMLDKIAKCEAVSYSNLTLDSSYVLTSDELNLYTEDGSIIGQSDLKLSTSKFSINIPVRTQKTVGLTVSIANAPADFDQSCLKFNMSVDSVVLAANNSQTEIPDTIDIGKIMLSDLDLDFSKTLTLSSVLENSDYINVSDVDAVTVSLDTSGLAKTDITLDQSRITISNKPDSNYSYSVLTQKLPIAVVGPEEIIQQLTADDIIADVNLLNADITTNQFNYYVTFSCPKYNNVWVVTKSTVSIYRTENEDNVETTTTQKTE